MNVTDGPLQYFRTFLEVHLSEEFNLSPPLWCLLVAPQM